MPRFMQALGAISICLLLSSSASLADTASITAQADADDALVGGSWTAPTDASKLKLWVGAAPQTLTITNADANTGVGLIVCVDWTTSFNCSGNAGIQVNLGPGESRVLNAYQIEILGTGSASGSGPTVKGTYQLVD